MPRRLRQPPISYTSPARIAGLAGVIDHTLLLNIGTNSHATIDTHIADATLHFTESSIDHIAILNIGTNSHAAIDTHISDVTIHFTEASIDHTAILNIGTNSHAAIDTHIADATLHFTEASIDHTAILNIGTNTHAAIDIHIADATLHFTEASIDHTAILNIGTNTHAQIDTHIALATVHFTEGSIDHTAILNIGTNSHAAIDTHITNNSTDVTLAGTPDYITISGQVITRNTIVATTDLSATGTKNSTTFLRGDDTWAVPPSSSVALNDLTDVTLTTPVTGGILYKSAGDWLDTDAIVVDPAGSVKLFNAGAETARTRDGGWSIIGDATDVVLDFYNDAGSVQEAFFQLVHTGLFRMRNLIDGGSIDFLADDAGGVARILATFDPDGAVTLNFAGAGVAATKSGGWRIFSELEIDGALNHDGTTIGFYGKTPAVQSAAYVRLTPLQENRTLLASAGATAQNNNNVLAALIADLQAIGILG